MLAAAPLSRVYRSQPAALSESEPTAELTVGRVGSEPLVPPTLSPATTPPTTTATQSAVMAIGLFMSTTVSYRALFSTWPPALGTRPVPRLWVGMEDLGHGLITLANGAYALVSTLMSPVSMFVVLSAASLAWLARLEVANLDRRAAKPEVGRH